MAKSRSLRAQLTRLTTLTTLISLALFAAITFAIIVLEDRADVAFVPELDDDPAFLLVAFAVAAVLSSVFAVRAAAWLSGRVLAPITGIIDAATEMSADQLDRRLPVSDDADELRDLSLALNGLFTRLEIGFDALERFAADASHQLRTPLAVAQSELEVTRRRPRTVAEWERAADRALGALGGLGRLVEALFELARGGEGAAREEVDLAELAEQVAALFEERARDAGVELAVEAGDGARVRADAATLATALSALVANAIRYTPAGGRARVRIERDGLRVAVHVDDSGPGVAESERARIVEPLTRGAAGLAADQQRGDEPGLGLGLAIARRIVRHHGGQLEIASSPLGGARFSLVWAEPRDLSR